MRRLPDADCHFPGPCCRTTFQHSVKNAALSQAEHLDSLHDSQGPPFFSALIINPTSGSYKKEKVAAAVAALGRAGVAVELVMTSSSQDTETCTRRICARNAVENGGSFRRGGGAIIEIRCAGLILNTECDAETGAGNMAILH